MQTFVQDMIDILQPERERWKPDTEDLIQRWGRAFHPYPSKLLMRACRSFLENQKGKPTVAKLMREVRSLQKRAGAPQSDSWRVSPEVAQAERDAVARELRRCGSPTAGYLVRHGKRPPTDYERDVLGWGPGLPCKPRYDAPELVS